MCYFYSLFVLFVVFLPVITTDSHGARHFYEVDGFNDDDVETSVSRELSRHVRESQPKRVTALPPGLSVPAPDQTFEDINSTGGATIKHDTHTYYNSSTYIGVNDSDFWINLDLWPPEEVHTHVLLSNSHRKASTISIKNFSFPFYGHMINNVTIATGGFLFVGPYIHSWLAATQYIAPLMANFDTRISNDSFIKYAENATILVVQWENLYLQDQTEVGPFTFQAAVHINGDIVLTYQKVPIKPSEIKEDKHPVKVGLSDAFTIRSRMRFTGKKKNTIYEYHRIDLKKTPLTDNSYIYVTALPTCRKFQDCDSCVSANIGFDCKWCENVKRCSTGTDRQRQEWMFRSCIIDATDTCPIVNTTTAVVPPVTTAIKTTTIQPSSTEKVTTVQSTTNKIVATTTVTTTTTATTTTETPSTASSTSEPSTVWTTSGTTGSEVTTNHYNVDTKAPKKPLISSGRQKDKDKSNVNIGAIVASLLIVTLIVSTGLWIWYAYKYPQTASGQFLIKYRPSQWKSSETSARYFNTS